MAALYVIVIGFLCYGCISRSKDVAVIHCWLFSHALMAALYVIVSSFMRHCCIARSTACIYFLYMFI